VASVVLFILKNHPFLLCFILCSGKVLQAAVFYGLIVHFRIYPIIYSLPFVLALSKQQMDINGKPALAQWSLKPYPMPVQPKRMGFISHLLGLFTRQTLCFGLVSGCTFVFLTLIFFCLYGWEFLNEALLYHLTRTDPRHNFSIYFYHIYLNHQKGFSIGEKVVSFLPQLMVQLALVLMFAWDLPFCLFVQTVAFVAFNKVCTNVLIKKKFYATVFLRKNIVTVL
jgi:GPI mannosyltransferase 1 subunit M